MKPKSATRSLTVRLTPEVYESSVRVAKRRRISLNSLVHESLAKQIEAEEDSQWRDWFDGLGRNQDEASVEFAIDAQSEAALKDEY